MTSAERFIQRKLGSTGFDFYVIGDIDGKTTEGIPAGYTRVSRYEGGAYRSSKQVLLADADTCFYSLIPGFPIIITVSRYYNEEVIKGTDTFTARALGFDIGLANPGSSAYNNSWVKMQNATLFLAVPRNPPDLKLDVNPLVWLDTDGTWHGFAGEKDIDATSYVSALSGDERQLMVLFLKTDDTIETQVSTAKTGPASVDPITITDLQECQDASAANAIPCGAFILRAGMTEITWADRWGDIRQWINVPVTASSILTDAAILAPGSQDRNLIQPAIGGAFGLRLRPHASQSVALLRVENSSNNSVFQVQNSEVTMTGAVNITGDLDVDNLNLNGNAIISTNTNGNISITPDGTGHSVIKNPEITTFEFAQHDHEDAAGGGQLALSALTTVLGDAGETLMRDNSGVVVSNPLQYGQRNLIIDGEFLLSDYAIPTPADGTSTYVLTLHQATRVDNGGSFTGVITRESFTIGQTDVPYEPQYFLRFDGGISGGGGNELFAYTYAIEDVRTAAGQNITISVYLRGGASGTVAMNIFQNFGSGGSATVFGTGQNISLTTSWQLFKLTFAVPSISGKTIGTGAYLGIRLFKVAGATRASAQGISGAMTFADELDIANFQAERGSIATPFEKRIKSLVRSMANWLYQKTYNEADAPGTSTAVGSHRWHVGAAIAGSVSGTLQESIDFQTRMRATPTITLYSTDGTSGAVRNTTAGNNRTGATAANISEVGVLNISISNASANAIAAGDILTVHWVADARL
jgi:hypothetical protein